MYLPYEDKEHTALLSRRQVTARYQLMEPLFTQIPKDETLRASLSSSCSVNWLLNN